MPGWLSVRARRRRWLFPDTCLLCDAPAGHVPNLCDACDAGLIRLPAHSPARLVAFAYRPPVTALIHWMKFEACLPAALTLGTLLAQAVLEAGPPVPDALLPVPLHPGRLRARGFNQSLEMARPLARRLGRPLLTGVCTRVRATRPQSALESIADRNRNVAHAFRVCEAMTPLPCIAIVDDVLTSGATARELARTLRAAGVGRVMVWACAGRPDASLKRRDWPPRERWSR